METYRVRKPLDAGVALSFGAHRVKEQFESGEAGVKPNHDVVDMMMKDNGSIPTFIEKMNDGKQFEQEQNNNHLYWTTQKDGIVSYNLKSWPNKFFLNKIYEIFNRSSITFETNRRHVYVIHLRGAM